MKKILLLIVFATLCYLSFSQKSNIKWKGLNIESPNDKLYSGYATQMRVHFRDSSWT